MKVGICCAWYGPSAGGSFIRRSALAAERAGFSAFWLPEHVVFFAAYPESRYPYTESGEMPMTSVREDFAEAVVGMTWAAAPTTKIEVGTSVLILPQRNPLVLAKQLATLDAFCGGRVVLGVGVGWAKEEFDAVGVNWSRRGKDTDEYIDAMRVLWRDDVSTFKGHSVSFKDAYLYPKPARDIPILIGGHSDAAYKRVARTGDGWIAAGMPVAEAKTCIQRMKELTRAEGRDPGVLRILVPIHEGTSMDEMKQYREAGVTEFYLGAPPQTDLDDAALTAHMADLGRRFVDPVASW